MAHKLEVGTSYLSYGKHTVRITRALAETDKGYDEGYRFVGVTDENGNYRLMTSTAILYTPEGKADPAMSSTPFDLTHRIRTLTIEEATSGMQVGDMHGHEIGKGPFSEWEIVDKFQIGHSMFQAMYLKIANGGKPYMGKMGYVVSASENNFLDCVSRVLIIYNYDSEYWIATIKAPDQLVKL